MCGIFEADVLLHVLIPHVPLTLHMGLLRYGLFEAKVTSEEPTVDDRIQSNCVFSNTDIQD